MMSFKSILAHAKKHFPYVLIGIITFVLMEYLGFFQAMSNYCYDMFFRLRGSVSPEHKIVIVAVDEITLKRYGQWPLARSNYAGLLDRLGQASIVGLDILMPEPSADDGMLADAIERHGRVILPIYIAGDGQVIHSAASFSPLASGHVHLERDIDSVIRGIYHTLYSNDQRIPSFALSLYEKSTGKSISLTKAPPGFGGFNARPGVVQTDQRKINYYGPPGTFPRVSMADVMVGKYPSEFFRDKVVMIGVTADGLETGVLTPFSQQRHHMSGVETHAHILGNLIDGRRLLDTPEPLVWLFSLGLSVLCILPMFRCRGWRVISCWLAGILAVVTVSFLLFAFFNLWFRPVPFVLLLTVTFFIVHIFRIEEAGRQLSETKELWEDTFNTLEDAILVMDVHGRVMQKNPAAEKLLSDSGLFSLLKKSYFVEAETGSNEKPRNDLERAFSKTVVDEIIDTESDRHFVIKKIPRRDGNLHFVGSVMVVQDISERKRVAREKQCLEFELMQAQKMEAIGTLAGGVAHDFNNILMGIQGYASLVLLDLDENSPYSDKLKKIESLVQSAANLTRQLLVFARGGKYEIKPTNLNELLEISSDVFGRTKKEVKINRRLEEDIWLVMADRGQVEQVLINMYINSWHAMPDGGELYLETRNVVLNDQTGMHGLRPGRYVKLSITDTGRGMDESTINRVFEPFFTTKEPGKGTGLGMASAYGIIKNHGGYIDVISEVGKGSTFHIYIPAASECEIIQEDVRPKAMERGHETILVVDDEPVNIMVMKELLQSLGYQVLCASSGQEAMSIYMMRKEKIDLIILDMIMPGMGGGSTFDALRGINRDAKIILSSGYSIDGEAHRIMDRGCDGFLQKPFLVNELTRKIRDVLQKNAPGSGQEP